jgi:hypothetical protein
MAPSRLGNIASALRGRPGLRSEIIAVAAVVIIAVLSWQMINAAATSLYRQYETLGYPPLVPIPVAGPELGDDEPPATPPSQLGHIGYFWSERAFHYRCALMFAVGDYQDPGALAADTWQQHPDGVNAWREYALLMEPVYGFLYRLAGDQARPFVEFLLRLVPLVHVLLFFPLYAAARALGCRRVFAVLGVVFYATCTLGFVRMTGSLLLKEDFALLLLGLFLAVHLWGWRLRSRWWTGAAALLLVPLLASWHLSQFLVLVVVLGTALVGAGEKKSGSGLPFRLYLPAVFALAGVAAGLTPALWARGFLISLPMAVLYAWVLVEFAAWRDFRWVRGTTGRTAILLVVTVGLAGLVFLNRSYTGDYNHVFGLFVEKLAHGFRLPADPGGLSFDTRVFWAPPFNTPTWDEIQGKLGYHALVLIPVLAWSLGAVLHRRTQGPQRAFLLTVPAFLAAYLLIERLGVVFLVFAAIAVAVFADWLCRRATPALGSRALPLLVGVMLVSPVLNLGGNLGDMVRLTRSYREGRQVRLGASDQALWQSWRSLFAWVTTATTGPGSRLPGAPAVFLGEIGVSPQLLLYTGRPIVLNSQFENRVIRARYADFLAGLYATQETDLWEFAVAHGADFVFINRNFATGTGPGTLAWQAGMPGPLTADMTVVRMHFQPTTLAGFRPVYDNGHYRVFRVLDRPAAPTGAVVWPSEHNSWWRRGNFRFEDGVLVDPRADRAELARFEGVLSDLQDRERKILAAVEKRWRSGRGAGGARPDLMLLHRQYGQARLESLLAGKGDAGAGRIENAIRARLSELDPLSGLPLGTALMNLATGPDGWLEQLDRHAGEPMQYATAGQLLALAGDHRRAADQFAEAAAFYPGPGAAQGMGHQEIQVRLWHEQVWWLLTAGETARARSLAARFADVVPASSREGEFFRRVRAIPGKFE